MKKKILITGGAKNLGSYLVEKLIDHGYSVILHYNTSEEEAKKIVFKCRQKDADIEMIQGDFSDRGSTNRFLDVLKNKTKDLYGFIHNVGNFQTGSLLETSISSWDDLIQTNLTASFLLLKEITPLLIPQKGHVICMGFVGVNSNVADLYSSVYFLTKQALLFMVKSLAKETATNNLKVNMISPGYLEKSVVMPKKKLPMGRTATFEDVFQTVLFLLSQTYITGQNIEVAGSVRL